MNTAVHTSGTASWRVRHDASRALLDEVLDVMRAHLGMEVAFLSRIRDGRQTFEYLNADPIVFPFRLGQSLALDDTYCARVLDGRVPALVPDARLEPALADLPVTQEIPIGSHVSVPVMAPDGSVYGTLCCFSRERVPGLDSRDVDLLRTFSDIVGKHVNPLVADQHERERVQADITRVLDEGSLRMALQPIVDLRTGAVTDYEALARFPGQEGWTPDRWFAAAEQVDMGTALESAAVHAAMSLLPGIPEGCRLAINVSAPALLASASIPAMFDGPEAARLVLELTEHSRIADPRRLTAALAKAREAGVRVAVDDAGSGYAGFERILTLHPEVLKLDRSLVHRVARNPARQAMCEAMARFTERTGARLVAEGVERPEDADMLRYLGVGYAQGYLFGRPTLGEGEG